MLKIVEIFYSIQGEGRFSGTPSLFVRFHGCNLSCSFCDEELHKGAYESFTKDELLKKVQEYPTKQVVITGGEPSIYDLNSFINLLHSNGYFVTVESNGYKFKNIQNADWLTYSPKDWEALHVDGFNEYKFIVHVNSDIQKILALNTQIPIYIQPENYTHEVNKTNTDFCIELVKKYPHLKLSVQLHKYLGVE